MKLRHVLLAALAVVALVCADNVAGAGAATKATTPQAMHSAMLYGKSHGVKTAIAVFDTRTGTMYHSGPTRTRMPSASVVKVYVAAYLLHAGKMYGYNAKRAWTMITRSDNSSFEYLLGKYFHGSASSLIGWMKAHYGFPYLGSGPSGGKSWCWGNTHITARGMAYFYAKVLRDPKVRPWLYNAMRHYVPVVEGFNQAFGIPHAKSRVSSVAIKQGWSDGCSPEHGYRTVINSTGIVVKNGHYYTVAILTESKYSIAWQKRIISSIADRVMGSLR